MWDAQSDFEKTVEENKILIVALLCLALLGTSGWFLLKYRRDKELKDASIALTSAETIEDYNLVIKDAWWNSGRGECLPR